MKKMSFLFILAVSFPVLIPANGLRVDIAPETGGRTDMFTHRWYNWVAESNTTISTTLGNITVTFRKAGSSGTEIKCGWAKVLIVNNTTLTCDGMTVDETTSGGTIEMVITGLSAGKHSLVTWHSFYDNVTGSTMEISVDGTVIEKNISVPTRVTNDYDARRVYVEFDVQAGKDVVVKFRPEGNGAYDNVVINAFEIDGTDPDLLASDVSPADGDYHFPMESGLSWKGAVNANSHDLYFGEDSASVSNATTGSAEFKGNQTSSQYTLKNLTSLKTYWWRIDEHFSNGEVKGDVYPFQIRRLAFPTAMGYGRFARGGRGGRVIEVTNCNDDGVGSLRYALENEKGPRTVVFRVGGVIPLNSKLIIRKDAGDVYIAGQTAPGDGICITRYAFGPLGAQDVIIRNIRLRVGDYSNDAMDGMGMASCDHCIIDHCSISWFVDEAYSSRGAKNITYQRNLVSEALNNSVHSSDEQHSFAASISGKYGSFLYNLHAHCAGRNWSLAGALEQDGKTYGGYVEIVNNVVYNWQHRTTDGGVRRLNFIGNYYKGGPESSYWKLVSIDGDELNTGDMQMGYISSNKMIDASGNVILSPNEDNWKICESKFNSVSDVKSNTLLFPLSITPKDADEAYDDVLANVGAVKPELDDIDKRILREVKDETYTFTGSKDKRKGIIDSQDDAGGYPTMKNGAPPQDSDRDGIPDSWETKYGLNPNDPSDGSRVTLSHDDYTNLELYLNELADDPIGQTHSKEILTNAIQAPVQVAAGKVILSLQSETNITISRIDLRGRTKELIYDGLMKAGIVTIPINRRRNNASGLTFLIVKGNGINVIHREIGLR